MTFWREFVFWIKKMFCFSVLFHFREFSFLLVSVGLGSQVRTVVRGKEWFTPNSGSVCEIIAILWEWGESLEGRCQRKKKWASGTLGLIFRFFFSLKGKYGDGAIAGGWENKRWAFLLQCWVCCSVDLLRCPTEEGKLAKEGQREDMEVCAPRERVPPEGAQMIHPRWCDPPPSLVYVWNILLYLLWGYWWG